jgi:hypothetical protein
MIPADVPKVSLAQILTSKRAKVGEIFFIAIDGRGGSGKSTLAKLLSEWLDAQVVRTDDFASWDNPLDWWPLAIEKDFSTYRRWCENTQLSPDKVVGKSLSGAGCRPTRERHNDFGRGQFFTKGTSGLHQPQDFC